MSSCRFRRRRGFIGAKSVTTDNFGNVSIDATFPAPSLAGHFITATATDPANNTSEFSGCRLANFGIVNVPVIVSTLYSISAVDNKLRLINPADGSTISSVTIVLAGKTVTNGTGLATDPSTGRLWALVRTIISPSCQGGFGGRIPELVAINPFTGVATSAGSTGDCFSGIAFTGDGTLYGVTGDGADVPETLYTLNKANAGRTFIRTLGNGDSGEAIAFNPNDQLLYHASGFLDASTVPPTDGRIFESINPGTGAVLSVPLTGFAYEESTALTFSQSDGAFLMGDLSFNFLRITAGGVVTVKGFLDHVSKGLAFVPQAPPPVDFDGDGEGDVAVYQTSTGNWFFVRSTLGFGQHLNFGGANFLPVPGDYDGDGETDEAVYDTTNGNWFIAQSMAGFRVHPSFGGAGFIPVPGDYDNDGKMDVSVYQTSTGHWFIVGSTSGFMNHLAFGGSGFVPVSGDYDGDGQTDTAVYQTSTGNWFIAQSTAGFLVHPSFGGTGFVPVLPQVTILRALGLL